MDSIKFAFLSIRKNAAAFVLVILELAALLLAVNFAMSTINDCSMLNASFRRILGSKTVFVYDTKYPQNAVEMGLNRNESRQIILDEIQGDYKIYDVLTRYTGTYAVISVSDEIYSRMKLPLVLGNRMTAAGTFGTSLGKHTIELEKGSLIVNVSGILTKNTYLPMMSSFGTNSFNTKDMFSTSTNTKNIIVTNRSAISGFEDEFTVSPGFFVTFENEYDENFKRLERVGGIISGKDLIKNSNAALTEDILSFVPVLLCVLFIVIIGMVSISIIISRQNEYRNGVMWLCGYSKKRILLIHAVNILFIMILSAVVGAITLGVLKITGNELAVTMNLSFANIIASLILFGFLLLVSLVIPAVKCAKTSLIEYLGRAK